MKLCDVADDGTSTLITRGFLNLTHRDGHTDAAPLTPGEFVDVEVELETCAYTVLPGRRLRLSVTGVDWPNTIAPPRTGDAHRGRRREHDLRLPPPQDTDPAPRYDQGQRAVERPTPVGWRISDDVVDRVTTATVEHGSTCDITGGSCTDRYTGSVTVDRRTWGQTASVHRQLRDRLAGGDRARRHDRPVHRRRRPLRARPSPLRGRGRRRAGGAGPGSGRCPAGWPEASAHRPAPLPCALRHARCRPGGAAVDDRPPADRHVHPAVRARRRRRHRLVRRRRPRHRRQLGGDRVRLARAGPDLRPRPGRRGPGGLRRRRGRRCWSPWCSRCGPTRRSGWSSGSPGWPAGCRPDRRRHPGRAAPPRARTRRRCRRRTRSTRSPWSSPTWSARGGGHHHRARRAYVAAIVAAVITAVGRAGAGDRAGGACSVPCRPAVATDATPRRRSPLRARGMVVVLAVAFVQRPRTGSWRSRSRRTPSTSGTPSAAGMLVALWSVGSIVGGLWYSGLTLRTRRTASTGSSCSATSPASRRSCSATGLVGLGAAAAVRRPVHRAADRGRVPPGDDAGRRRAPRPRRSPGPTPPSTWASRSAARWPARRWARCSAPTAGCASRASSRSAWWRSARCWRSRCAAGCGACARAGDGGLTVPSVKLR